MDILPASNSPKTCRLLLAENHFSEIVVYEQRDALGGIWNYEDSMFPPSVYLGLESNILTSIMEYSDSHFPQEHLSYPADVHFETILKNMARTLDLSLGFGIA